METNTVANQNKEIIQKVNETFKENDTEAFLALCMDDICWNMIGSPALAGKDAIRNDMNAMEFEGPPQITVDELIAEADKVVCTGTVTMTKKTGEPYCAAYCDVYRLKNGKIQELNSYVVEQKTTADR